MPNNPATEIQTIASLWEWGKSALPLVVAPRLPGRQIARKAAGNGQLTTAVRWAMDQGAGAVIKAADGRHAVLSPAAWKEVGSVVPTSGPERALMAFIGTSPSAMDAARGQPLSGLDGRVFQDAYLTPLGLTRDQVMTGNLLPLSGEPSADAMAPFVHHAKQELQAWAPHVVVALGKAAKQHLGPLAQFTLPHPALVRKCGDKGELARKLKKIRKRLEELTAPRKVHIAKALAEKQIVYGVVADPYQFDTQQDWIPAWEIEATAHDYIESSRVVGFMHEQKADACVVESYLWPYPTPQDYDAAMRNAPHSAFEASYGADKVHSGAWVLGTKVSDPAVWAAIKAGEITGYSLGGSGVRVKVDPEMALPQVTFVKV
jgi:uracil-DNA glycosylase